MFWTQTSTGATISKPVPSKAPMTNDLQNQQSSSQTTLSIRSHLDSSLLNYENSSLKFLTLINELREIGAENVVELPRICVAGNQSVGKSSLLEGISGVSLPRGDVTCTRCVIEIQMRRSQEEDWKCLIKLKRREDEMILFATTTNPDTTDNLIRKAQKALLNPSSDWKKFLLGDISTKDELLFTDSTVVIDIVGAQVDLSLIDLPGIIKSVQSTQDQKLIPMIESVITDYISQPKTLILAVFSCKDDMENQAIFRMAREVDPLGERTIGCLSKPDTIEKGTHDRWLKIMNGELYYLKLGYFMVKMPSKTQIDSGIDSFEAEEEFFKSSPIWSPMRSQLTDRFGIASLRSELGVMLTSLIESCLPLMKQATQASLLEVNRVLEDLPPVPGTDAKVELLQIIRHYSTLVSYHINAQQNLKVFNQKVKKHCEAFKDAVVATRPKMVSSKPVSSSSPISSFWRRSTTPTDSPPKQPSSMAPSNGGGNCFTLEDLKSIVSSQKGKELDGAAPYAAFEHLVKKSQTEWKTLVTILINNVSAELENLTGKLVLEVFGRFPNLRVHIRNLVQVLQNDLKNTASEMVGHSVVMESRHPFTLSSLAYINGKQHELDHLQQAFPSESGKLGTEKGEAVKRAVVALNEAGVKGITAQTLMTRLSPQNTDSYLLDLVASSASYFDISSCRFIDTVCLQIDYHFLLAFTEFLEKEMVEGLGVLDKAKSEEDLRGLLVEDSGVAKKRSKYSGQRMKLEEIWRKLQMFGVA